MRYFLSLLVLLVCLISCVIAGPGTYTYNIGGVVKDQNNQGVPGADVYMQVKFYYSDDSSWTSAILSNTTGSGPLTGLYTMSFTVPVPNGLTVTHAEEMYYSAGKLGYTLQGLGTGPTGWNIPPNSASFPDIILTKNP